MITECPEAFAGYASDGDGFYVTICKLCPDRQQAKKDFKAIRTRDGLCAKHQQEQLAARMGERIG